MRVFQLLLKGVILPDCESAFVAAGHADRVALIACIVERVGHASEHFKDPAGPNHSPLVLQVVAQHRPEFYMLCAHCHKLIVIFPADPSHLAFIHLAGAQQLGRLPIVNRKTMVIVLSNRQQLALEVYAK